MRANQQGTKTAKGYWRVCVGYQDDLGRKRTKCFESKTLSVAQSKAREFLTHHGRIAAKPQPSGTVADAFEQVERQLWSQSGPAHQKEMARYRKAWEGHIGELNVTEVTSPVLTRCLARIGEGKSASLINKAKLAIRSALAFAVSDLGWIERNPADGMRAPRGAKTSLTYPPMTLAEYRRMLELAPPRIAIIIRLMGECAMRPSEAVRVRPEHLFTVADRWLVQIPVSKTAAGIRPVPVPDDLARQIEAISEADWTGVKDPCEHIRKWWREHSKTRMYDLRGWRADEWRREGIPEQVRTFLLGHTKTTFTQAVYEQLTSEDMLKTFPR
jgi:integrase